MNGKIRFPSLAQHQFQVTVAEMDTAAMHGHDFLEFSYVTRGVMEHEIDGQRSILREGDYFIVDYGTQHAYRSLSDEPLQVVNMLFYPEFLERSLANCRYFEDVINSYLLRFSYRTLRSSPTGKTFHDDNDRIRPIVDEIVSEFRRKRYGYIEYIRCRFVEMLILTMRKIGKSEQALGKSEVVREITDYINENYAGTIRLSDMAEKYNYSVSYLSRKFSAEVGMGFSDYVQRIRIEQSCRLLEQSELRVGDIAEQVGYDNLKFFNQIFRNTLGVTPREFRRSRKQ